MWQSVESFQLSRNSAIYIRWKPISFLPAFSSSSSFSSFLYTFLFFSRKRSSLSSKLSRPKRFFLFFFYWVYFYTFFLKRTLVVIRNVRIHKNWIKCFAAMRFFFAALTELFTLPLIETFYVFHVLSKKRNFFFSMERQKGVVLTLQYSFEIIPT